MLISMIWPAMFTLDATEVYKKCVFKTDMYTYFKIYMAYYSVMSIVLQNYPEIKFLKNKCLLFSWIHIGHNL